jgi:hypothetical protein
MQRRNNLPFVLLVVSSVVDVVALSSSFGKEDSSLDYSLRHLLFCHLQNDKTMDEASVTAVPLQGGR